MNSKRKVFIPILVVMILALSMVGVNTASASSGATTTLEFDASSCSLTVEVYSPVGISGAQLKLSIPAELTIANASTTGFMGGATHLAHGTEHRWFALSANGEASGSLALSLAIPENLAYEVTLLGVDLKDTNGSSVQVDTPLPGSVSVWIVVLTTSVSPAGSGSVSPEGGTYDNGAAVELTAVPTEGCEFDYWSGADDNYQNPTTVTMSSSKTVTAYFTKISCALGTAVSPVGSGSVNPSGGTYEYGTVVPIEAQPAEGYDFDYWSGADDNFANPTTVTMTAETQTVTAYLLKRQYALSASVSPAGSGSVSVSPTQDTYEHGTSVGIEAHRGYGYAFDHWGGDASGTSNTTTLTMDSHKSVMAFFRVLGEQDIFEAVDCYFEDTPCGLLSGNIPAIDDIFDLLDEYFGAG